MKTFLVLMVVFFSFGVTAAKAAAGVVTPAPAPTNAIFLTGEGVKGNFAPYTIGINCVFDSAKLPDGRVINGPAVGRFNKATGLVEFTNAGCWLEPGVSVAARHAWAVGFYKKSLALVPDMLVAPTSTATATRTATRTATVTVTRTATATRTATRTATVTVTRTATATRTATITRTATATRTATTTATPLAELPSDWQSLDAAHPNGVQAYSFKVGSLVWAYEVLSPPPGYGLEGKKDVMIDVQKDITLTVSQGAARFNSKIPLGQAGNYLFSKYGYRFTLVTIK